VNTEIIDNSVIIEKIKRSRIIEKIIEINAILENIKK